MAWVRAHAAELIAIAASYGATRVALTGSVARGDDVDDSDLDFYVWEFDYGEPGSIEESYARERADDLVHAFEAAVPYRVDVRPLPGWLVDPRFDASMRRDAIDLEQLIEPGD